MAAQLHSYENDPNIYGKASLEETIVRHFFYSLDDLKSTWINQDGEFNRDAFNLQILYLIRTLPNREKQKEILDKWFAAQKENIEMGSLSKNEVIAYSGMEVVTEIVMFICDAFKLITTDITGPATGEQYNEVPNIQDPDIAKSAYEDTMEREDGNMAKSEDHGIIQL